MKPRAFIPIVLAATLLLGCGRGNFSGVYAAPGFRGQDTIELRSDGSFLACDSFRSCMEGTYKVEKIKPTNPLDPDIEIRFSLPMGQVTRGFIVEHPSEGTIIVSTLPGFIGGGGLKFIKRRS